MSWSRRAFLHGLGGTGLAVLASRVVGANAQTSQPFLLDAKPGQAQLLEAPGGPTPIWGYQGRVPGPTLSAKRGGQVWVRLKNSLAQPTTIHWHGIRIDNAMDGVAHLTQHAVEPGQSFDYRFTVPDAGTFWYHPHHASWEQVERGLYGALIVEEAEAVDVDQDLVLILDDWRLEDSGAVHEASFGALHDKAHAGRLGNVLSVNGAPSADLLVKSGERIRLRLLNACNARVLQLQLKDVRCHLAALDGQPVPVSLLPEGRVAIAPGQRVDLILDMVGKPGSTSDVAEVSNEPVTIARLVCGADAAKPARNAIVALPANKLLAPDLGAAEKVDLIMTGGAMGSMREAMYQGARLSIRDLVQKHGQVWAMNGIAGMPDKPLFSAPRGKSVIIRMVNDTRWPHAMHLHGHHVREVVEGQSTPSPWRDTVLVEPMQRRSYAMLADNPGKWMIHCHMLEHQASGMETWFEVT